MLLDDYPCSCTTWDYSYWIWLAIQLSISRRSRSPGSSLLTNTMQQLATYTAALTFTQLVFQPSL